MKYQDLIDSWKRFGSSPEEVCKYALGISFDKIQERVIIAPLWNPEVFNGLGNEITLLSKTDNSAICVWEVKADDYKITYIKTGIGAPVLSDAVLALAGTGCKKILFIGSAGALDNNISIGDIVVPKLSICGDGMSRYLKGSPLKVNDPFGEVGYPDLEMFQHLLKNTMQTCDEGGVKWHIGTTFSIDTIVAQFLHIDEIMGMGCNVIEMETSSAFRAASIVNKRLVALFSITDNTLKNQSLISKRSESKMDCIKDVIKDIFPKIIIKTLA